MNSVLVQSVECKEQSYDKGAVCPSLLYSDRSPEIKTYDSFDRLAQ